MSGWRRLGLITVVTGAALIGALVVRRAGVAPPPPTPSTTVPAAVPQSSAAARVVGAATPPVQMPPPTPEQTSTATGSSAPQPGAAPAVLTPLGASRALQAIGKNEQMRRLFMRLQPLGLSREQQDRVLVILGTAALRPAAESPTLQELRASGGSRVLTEDEANRVRNERQRIDERAVSGLRPALATVLTPAQMDRAGLGGKEPLAGARARAPR
jgi:hypothetical protein